MPAEQDTAMNEVLFDVSLNDDYMPDETEGRSLRREGSTRSQISFGEYNSDLNNCFCFTHLDVFRVFQLWVLD